MPLTIGEIIAGGSLGAAFLSVGGWIRSIANKCGESETRMCGRVKTLDGRIKTLETTVTEKSGLIAIHSTNLSAGEKQMDEMKSQLETMNISINGTFMLMKDVSSKMDLLGEKFAAGTKEVFMKLDPRIKRVEEKVDDLENDDNKK